MQRSLNHPNLVSLSQVLETQGSIYFAKPYNPNQSLEFILKKSNQFFTSFESQTAKIIKSVLQGLDYLAYQGAMLENLHPGNIVITKEGQVKVVDFVFQTKYEKEELFDETSLRSGYIAPEMLKSSKTAFDKRSNVFSVGCILFEMLFGFPLFNAKDPSNILRLNKSYDSSYCSEMISNGIDASKSPINKQGIGPEVFPSKSYIRT